MDDDQANWYSGETATFGDRLAGAREAQGMSDVDLARHLGVKLKTLRAWEEDMAEPRANKLQMVAGLLSVSLSWLLTGEGDGLPHPDAQPVPADVAPILTEMRRVQGELVRAVDRLAVLEKRLAAALREQG